jgi:hypothetical protein
MSKARVNVPNKSHLLDLPIILDAVKKIAIPGLNRCSPCNHPADSNHSGVSFHFVHVIGVLGDFDLTPQRSYICFFPNLDSSLPALNGFFNLEDTGIIVSSFGVV